MGSLNICMGGAQFNSQINKLHCIKSSVRIPYKIIFDKKRKMNRTLNFDVIQGFNDRGFRACEKCVQDVCESMTARADPLTTRTTHSVFSVWLGKPIKIVQLVVFALVCDQVYSTGLRSSGWRYKRRFLGRWRFGWWVGITQLLKGRLIQRFSTHPNSQFWIGWMEKSAATNK